MVKYYYGNDSKLIFSFVHKFKNEYQNFLISYLNNENIDEIVSWLMSSSLFSSSNDYIIYIDEKINKDNLEKLYQHIDNNNLLFISYSNLPYLDKKIESQSLNIPTFEKDKVNAINLLKLNLNFEYDVKFNFNVKISYLDYQNYIYLKFLSGIDYLTNINEDKSLPWDYDYLLLGKSKNNLKKEGTIDPFPVISYFCNRISEAIALNEGRANNTKISSLTKQLSSNYNNLDLFLLLEKLLKIDLIIKKNPNINSTAIFSLII